MFAARRTAFSDAGLLHALNALLHSNRIIGLPRPSRDHGGMAGPRPVSQDRQVSRGSSGSYIGLDTRIVQKHTVVRTHSLCVAIAHVATRH